MSELSLLNNYIFRANKNKDVILPNGDDAAVMQIGNSLIAITTDEIVEDRHFSLNYFLPNQVGIKCVESAVSDLVATGAIPKGIVISLGLKKGTSEKLISEVYTGIFSSCQRLNIELLGGDIVSTESKLELTVTAIGLIESKEDILRRSGARVGDLICITGDIGSSQAGLRAIQNNLDYPFIRLKHLEPNCRIDLVGKLKNVNSAIDISDGLSSEINHICRNSNCGAVIHSEKIPVNPDACKIASTLGDNVLEYALNGGEDYELLLTVSPENYRKELGTIIGEITAEKDVLIERNGEFSKLVPNGYDHLQ